MTVGGWSGSSLAPARPAPIIVRFGLLLLLLPVLVAFGCHRKVEAPLAYRIERESSQSGRRVMHVAVPRRLANRDNVRQLARYLRDEYAGAPIGINFFDNSQVARQPVEFGKENQVPLKDEQFYLHYLAHYEYTPDGRRERYVALAPLDSP